jgi:hypothetical protein
MTAPIRIRNIGHLWRIVQQDVGTDASRHEDEDRRPDRAKQQARGRAGYARRAVAFKRDVVVQLTTTIS